MADVPLPPPRPIDDREDKVLGRPEFGIDPETDTDKLVKETPSGIGKGEFRDFPFLRRDKESYGGGFRNISGDFSDIPSRFVEEQPPNGQLPPGRGAISAPAPDPFAQGPATADVISAAFRRTNPIAGLLDTVGRMPGNEATPGYNPMDTLRGTPHEGDDLSIYAGSQNEAHTRALMDQKDREDTDRQTLAASGRAGTVASLAAGLLDPAFAIPIFGEGAGLAAYGAGLGVLEDTERRVMTPRTWQESAGNIASSAILMGVLGRAGGMLTKSETASAIKVLDEVRPRVDAVSGDVVAPQAVKPPVTPRDLITAVIAAEPLDRGGARTVDLSKVRAALPDLTRAEQDAEIKAYNEPGTALYPNDVKRLITQDQKDNAVTIGGQPRHFFFAGDGFNAGVPSTAGAASTDVRQLELKGALGVEKLSGIPKVGLASPNLGIYNASSVEARRAMRDVSEFGGLFKDAGEGQTAPFGSPLESQARVLKGQALVKANEIIERTWFDHYGAEAGEQGSIKGFLAKQGVVARTAGDKLGFGDFDRAVGEAMHNGDTHTIPEVQAAAQELRSKVYDPIKESAQQTLNADGKPMLGMELDAPKGAQSFFPLIFKRDAWIAKRPEAERMLTDYYEGEQTAKAAARDRLKDLSDQRERLGGQIGRLGEEADPWIAEGLHADHRALGERIEEEIENWKGNTTREAVAAIEKRDMAAARGSEAGTKPAADAVEAAVRRILASDRDLSRQELASRAQQTVDRIIGSPDGRLAYDDAGSHPFIKTGDDARGSLMARHLPIDVNELISRGLVDTSASHGTAALARTIIPDVLLTRRFGDVAMTDTFRRINEEYSGKLTEQTSEKASTALGKERDGVIRDLAAARDRLRGVYGWDPSPLSQQYATMIRDMQNINALRALGTSVANRMTDATNAIIRYGLTNVFQDAFAPFFQGLIDPELRRTIRDQARDAAVGIDGLLGHMRHNLYDVNDSRAPGNKFSRGLAYASDLSMIANVHGPWTDWNKMLVFNTAQGELGRVVARVVAGKETKSDLVALDGLSIDRGMAARIADQYDKHAIEVSGRKFADAPNWTDRGAKLAFESAMTREANATVLTAGIGQRPLLMDKNIGRLGLQFKSFTAAAHENILLSSLQKRDMRVVEGVLSSVAMGMMGTALYRVASGQPMSEDPREWIKEGLDRAAMTGWFGDINNVISKVTGGQIDYNRLYGATGELTRRREQSLEGALGGPTVDLAEKLAQAGSHAVTRTPEGQTKFTGSDVHAVRQALPLQNLWAFRRLLDQVEGSATNAFGLKPKPAPKVH